MGLETTFRTPTGTVAVLDAMAMGEGNRGHELGNGAPNLLLRRATCIEGEVGLHMEYVPRPEYGLVHPCSTPSTMDSPLSAEPTFSSSLVQCF